VTILPSFYVMYTFRTCSCFVKNSCIYVLHFTVMLQVITSIYKYSVPKKGFKLKINTCDDCDSDCSPVPVTPDHQQSVSAVSPPQYTTCIRWTQGWLIEVKVFSDVTPCDLSRTQNYRRFEEHCYNLLMCRRKFYVQI
jgi:hypothetical protein